MSHGGALAARALKDAGVDCVFTLSGGHVMGIYDGCLDEGIRVVDVRHEQAAVHAADAWARLHPGRVGVAILTAGPGVTDGVTGVANAWRANSPILVIGGQGPFDNLRRGSLQEMDHVSVMRPITKLADTCYQSGRIAEYVELAIRTALSGIPGPVIPRDPDGCAPRPGRPRLGRDADVSRLSSRSAGAGQPHRAGSRGVGGRANGRSMMAGHGAQVERRSARPSPVRRVDLDPLLHERHGSRPVADGSSAVLQPHAEAGAVGGGCRGVGRYPARLPHEVRPIDPARRQDRAARPRRDAHRAEPIGGCRAGRQSRGDPRRMARRRWPPTT